MRTLHGSTVIETFTSELEPGKPAYGVRRTRWWPSADGLTFLDAGRLGASVAEALFELDGGQYLDSQKVLHDASVVAIEQPPLLGHHLLHYMDRANEFVEAKQVELRAQLE